MCILDSGKVAASSRGVVGGDTMQGSLQILVGALCLPVGLCIELRGEAGRRPSKLEI